MYEVEWPLILSRNHNFGGNSIETYHFEDWKWLKMSISCLSLAIKARLCIFHTAYNEVIPSVYKKNPNPDAWYFLQALMVWNSFYWSLSLPINMGIQSFFALNIRFIFFFFFRERLYINASLSENFKYFEISTQRSN